MSRKRERGKERKKEKNAIYSGHLRLCQQPSAAHALRSDQLKDIQYTYHSLQLTDHMCAWLENFNVKRIETEYESTNLYTRQI